jgi:hypothetical protein
VRMVGAQRCQRKAKRSRTRLAGRARVSAGVRIAIVQLIATPRGLHATGADSSRLSSTSIDTAVQRTGTSLSL